MRFFCLGLMALSLTALAQDPKPDMHVMATEITALQKYMFSDAEFSASKNESAIKNSLQKIQGHLGHLGEGAFANDPSLKVNLTLLQQQMKDADRAFTQGSKPFSRYMLQSSLQMCIACHTRKNTPDFAWPEPDAKDIAPMDKADYFFATRQFSKGVTIYEDIVAGYPANHTSQFNVRKALLALAVYYARVAEKPGDGEAYFKKMAAKEELPQYLREELKDWSAEFGSWSREPKKASDAKFGEQELLARAKKLLKHDDFSLVSEGGRKLHVRRLRATVLLQRVLEMPGEKSPTKGEALLLLGKIYARISSTIFFRFGEMYLKACVKEYPKSATAKSCYLALEESVTEGYSGSAGTNVPDDEQVELFQLKRLAY